QQLEGNLPMVWHIAITNMHLHLSSHSFSTQSCHGKTGCHTEEENTSTWFCKQNSSKLCIRGVHNVNREIRLIITARQDVLYLLDKLKWMCRIARYHYICYTKGSNIL